MSKLLFKSEISEVAVSPISFTGTRLELVSVMQFQTDDNEELNMLKLRQQTGEFNIMVDHEMANSLKPYQGKLLKISGIVKSGKKHTFCISSVELVD